VSEEEDEDDDDDSYSSEMIIGNLFPHGPGVEGGDCGGDEYGEEECGGEEDDIDFPNTDDADSVPDAEVNKYSFLERLCHYMDGITISDANRKCVEWTILFEVGTLVRNMDTMRTADMKARIFSKYVNIDRDIWCAEKCCIGSRLVSRICVVEICCVGGRVKQQLPIVLVQISGSSSDVGLAKWIQSDQSHEILVRVHGKEEYDGMIAALVLKMPGVEQVVYRKKAPLVDLMQTPMSGDSDDEE
jgi:hypothetical protein